MNIEVANLAKVKQVPIELSPVIHASEMDVMRQMIDPFQANAVDLLRRAVDGSEVHVVNRPIAITVDEIYQTAAYAPDGRNVELHRSHSALVRFSAAFNGALQGVSGIFDSDGKGAYGRAVYPGKSAREAIRLMVDDEIDVALPIKSHLFGTVMCDRQKTQPFKQSR